MTDYFASLLDPSASPGRVPFVKEMVRVIWGLANKGSAVIIGRGANWFLDPGCGLRLRCVAPLEQRAASVAEQGNLAAADAARLVREHDERQAEFVRRVYGESIDDPLGYDCVLNLGSLDTATATRIALAALQDKLG